MSDEPKKDLRTVIFFTQKDAGNVYAFLDSFSETRLSVTQPILLQPSESNWACYYTREKDVVCHFTIPGNILVWYEVPESEKNYYFSRLKELKLNGYYC